MDGEQLVGVSAIELAQLIVAKELSPVEAMRWYLDRIDRLDPQLSSYITVCRREALQSALKAEQAVVRGDSLGPLHGVPLGVKDQFETKGIPTTAGSRILADNVPDEDATVVARLKEAGAIVIGKQNMTAFASGLGDRFQYGDPRNPWDLRRTASGSSTGSAIAVSASLCAISLGEDTGGSIRLPAALTGIVGLRPSWGLVSRHGILPVCWSMDTAGPMTRTVADAALVMEVIAGHDRKDPLTAGFPVPKYTEELSGSLEGLSFGVLCELTDQRFVDAEVLRAVEMAVKEIENLGAVVKRVSLPLVAEIEPVTEILCGSSAAFLHQELLRTRPGDLGPSRRRRLLAGSLIPAQTLEKATRARAIFRQEWQKLFLRFDGLLSPTTVSPAVFAEDEQIGDITSRDEAEERFIWHRSPTMGAALAGTPAITVPCGFNSENLPIGLQIMTDRFQEALMFKAAYAYEQTTLWHERRPDV
ncbi:amidase [Candidatus Bipolaricaulota bacterium]